MDTVDTVFRSKSFLMGKDYQALDTLIDIHASNNPLILDCTHNKGVMWKKCKYTPFVKMDIRSDFNINVAANYLHLPFRSEIFDVIVFDPPHLPINAASKNSSNMWLNRYGITADRAKGDNISNDFDAFVIEAFRVLKNDGIILAKIADLTHNHRYQWQHIFFIQSLWKMGHTACDMLIKADPSAGNLISSKWEKVNHLRKSHCYWIVCRKGLKCEK